ncbi:hypothetical protein JXC34_04780 [Candidatus Woesearchaeota archaeon]|nr:hypothetical protein [Candidatus Woesearchaeota archaeon]
MKRLIAILLSALIISIVITGCAKSPGPSAGDSTTGTQDSTATEATGDEITGDITESITETDSVEEDLDVDELDTELDSLSEDLENW